MNFSTQQHTQYCGSDLHAKARVQDFVSSCRLVQCAKESSGKKLGTAGNKIDTVHVRWACAEAAVLCIR